MIDISRKKLVDGYFMQKPKPDYLPPLLCLVGGLLISFVGSKQKGIEFTASGELARSITTQGWQIIVFGLAVAAVGVIIGIERYKTVLRFDTREKATDQQMDEWLESDKQMILKESLQALDMESDDTSACPLMIDGTTPDAPTAVGDDKVLRYSAHSILIFYLTEQHVATFKCKLDMALGYIVEQDTREFPYKDITNLETITRNTSIEFASEKISAIKGKQEFSLYTSGNNKISVYYLFSKSSTSVDDYIIPPSDAESTIKAVRKKLKEYKDRIIPSVSEFNMNI